MPCQQVRRHDSDFCLSHDPATRCVAIRKRDGQRCTKPPTRGNNVCPSHGGNAPQVKAAGQRRIAAQKARTHLETLGLPREVDPATALLEEVWRSAGHVAWLGRIIAGADHDDARLDGSALVADGQPSVWVRLYNDERDRLAKVSKMALDAGVAQALVDIAHTQSAQLIRYTDALLRELGHDPDAPEVREMVHAQLRLVAAG